MGIDPSRMIKLLQRCSSAGYALHLVECELSGKSAVSSNNSEKPLFLLRLLLVGDRFYSSDLLQVSSPGVERRGNMLTDEGKVAMLSYSTPMCWFSAAPPSTALTYQEERSCPPGLVSWATHNQRIYELPSRGPS